jgi:hypothetical protein
MEVIILNCNMQITVFHLGFLKFVNVFLLHFMARVHGGKRFFSSLQYQDQIWGLCSLLFSGHQGLFPPGVKRPWHDARHSPASAVEIKNGGIIPTPPHSSPWHVA